MDKAHTKMMGHLEQLNREYDTVCYHMMREEEEGVITSQGHLNLAYSLQGEIERVKEQLQDGSQ